MNNQDWYEAGEKIGQLVSDAVDSEDYAALSKKVAGIIGDSLDALQENLTKQREMQKRSRTATEEKTSWRREGDEYVEVKTTHTRVHQTTSVGEPVKGLLAMVLGYSGSIIFGAAFLLMMLLWAVGGLAGAVVPTLLFGGLSIGSYLVARRGKKIRRVVRRERQSFERSGDKGQTIEGTYKEVHEHEPADKAKSRAEDVQSEQQARKTMEQYSPETRKILEEGDEFIRQIHQANIQIEDADMSEKLDRLEHVVTRIFTQVAAAPDSAPDLRRMMSYYIPTTTKLINAYCELDAHKIGGTNIENTKREIEGSLDTINQAFEIFLDSFFQDTAWDIETDIKAMKSMMAHDGLVRSAFDRGGAKETEKTDGTGQAASAQTGAGGKTAEASAGGTGQEESAGQMMQQH